MEDFLNNAVKEAHERIAALNQQFETKIAEANKIMGMREQAQFHFDDCLKKLNDYKNEVLEKTI